MKEVHQSTHDTILAEYEAKKAKKEAAKAEMPQKARIYKRITSISFTVTCVAAIAAMYLTLAHVLSDQSLITSIFLIGVGTITIAGALVFFTAIIAKKNLEAPSSQDGAHAPTRAGLTSPQFSGIANRRIFYLFKSQI